MKASMVCALMVLLATASNAAAPTSSPLSAIPPDGFSFIGHWDCEGSFRTGQTHRAVFTGATILGDKWLELTEQDVQPKTGYLGKYLIGYDSQKTQLIEFDANNFGAAVYTSLEGWQSGVLTMTSAINQGPKARMVADRFLYTVASQDVFTVDWQTSKAIPLNWETSDHLSCKRQSKP
jgi:hypothetical protein